MNDVDFPVQSVLDGIEAAAAAGLPVKVNVVVKRGVNEDSVLADGAPFPRQRATSCASSSTWTSGTRTAGAWTTSCPPRRSSRPSTRSCRSSRCRPATGRGRRALPLPRRRRGDRRDRVRHAPVLRRLHRARLSAEGRSTRASSRRPATTCAPWCAKTPATTRSPPRSAGSGASGPTAIRSSARPRRLDLPKVEMSYIGG